jgi:ribosomal protein L25 (general stress protein Ctc)
MKVEQATLKEHKDHNTLVAKSQALKDKINKADVRTEGGKAEFREVWRQVASPAFMYSPTTPLWSLATLLKTIAPLSHKMNSVVNKLVQQNKMSPGIYEFKKCQDC